MGWSYVVAPPLVGLGYLAASGVGVNLFEKWTIGESVALGAVVLLMVAGIWYKTFLITVDDKAIEVCTLFRRRIIPYPLIEKIDLIESAGRGATKTLNVYDANSKRLLCVFASLRDFDDLVGLLKFNCLGNHVTLRRRDSFGTWSAL